MRIGIDIDGVLNDINDMMNNIGISKRIYNRGYPNLKNDYEQNKKYIEFNFSFEKIQILKQIIVRVLVETEYLNSTKAKYLNPVWLYPVLENAIKNNGDTVVLPAFNCFS